ncbi:hypothetical protein [Trichlorobacter lovleyi]|uniref:hypothetical protein n=1 Tax=Trichlorobacter lovleyi TaxID=313985 RepID=UPI003D13A15C
MTTVNPSKRNRDLIATFENSFAKGWHMAVRDCFKDQLDIRYTPIMETYIGEDGKKHKKQIYAWTQGRCYCFTKYHIIYDSVQAYSGIWLECLKYINVAYKVISAIPSYIKSVEINGAPKQHLIEGFLTFEVLIPNKSKDRLIISKEVSMSQSNFVNLLKYGPEKTLSTQDQI